MFEHNYEMCNRNGLRCIHCCDVDYSKGKEFYDKLFVERREKFDEMVKVFPQDVIYFYDSENSDYKSGVDPCFFLGDVDGNPGCMIHPSLWEGVDVRADKNLIGDTCYPTKGCYFNQYFKTKPEQKILEEFLQDVDDWFSYSKALHDSAVYNKGWGYIISRMSENEVCVGSVEELVKEINCSLKNQFPNDNGPIGIGSVSILESVRKKKRNIYPTEYFMLKSKQFVNWGLNMSGYILGEVTFTVESRFKQEDFAEWGHFFEEESFFVYKPIGEILPINFNDVSITSKKNVKDAIEIVDKVIENF